MGSVIWLVWIRVPGRHVMVVRVVGVLICGLLALVVAGVSLLDRQAYVGERQIVVTVGIGVAAALPGLVGIIRWRGRIALALRWVGLFVLLVPTMYVGLFAVSAALFYAPALQPASRVPQPATED